jgi:predicted Zn-dependent protease with MMP-like domain
LSYVTLSENDWEQLDHVWDLLDEGNVEGARGELRSRFRARLDHPDVRIVDAAVALEEGRPDQALAALVGAERSADPALFFHLRGAAHFDRWQFADAKEDAERALTVRADFADAHDLLSRTYEHLDDEVASLDHAQEAAELDPEQYPLPLEMSDGEFDELVEESLREIPEPVRKHLAEFPVVVEALPEPKMLSDSPHLAPDLLGLFVGRDLMSRRHQDLPSPHGGIYLFRRNLLRYCRTPEDLAREVRITVQHEIGHLLGLDENDLEQWGLA